MQSSVHIWLSKNGNKQLMHKGRLKKKTIILQSLLFCSLKLIDKLNCEIRFKIKFNTLLAVDEVVVDELSSSKSSLEFQLLSENVDIIQFLIDGYSINSLRGQNKNEQNKEQNSNKKWSNTHTHKSKIKDQPKIFTKLG